MSAIHISLAAEPIFHIGSMAISNSILTGVLASAVTFGICVVAARAVSLYPKSYLGLGIEAISEAFMGMIENVTLDKEKAARFFPLLMTIFLFILVNNWFGLLPGIGSITITTEEGVVPLLRGATADLNTTFGLAIISVVMTQVYAIKELGLFKHMKKYISANPILLFVGILEFVSEFSKMLSFSFRLFGNIFAGEVLLVVMAYLVPAVGPLPFFALELFVGIVQALVFTMLTLVFLQIATSDHAEHHEASTDEKQLAGMRGESVPLS